MNPGSCAKNFRGLYYMPLVMVNQLINYVFDAVLPQMQRRGKGVEDVFYAPKEEECVGGV